MKFAIPFPEISPVLVDIPLGFTSLSIRWYALAYIVGIVLGYLLARRTLSRENLWINNTPPMDGPRLEEFLTWLIIGIILGGRIGYVIGYGDGRVETRDITNGDVDEVRYDFLNDDNIFGDVAE